jgi:hypothetical protein
MYYGGVEPLERQIKDSDFKYTVNEERKTWVKNMYPYSDFFFSLLKKLKIEEYSFDGVCTFTHIEHVEHVEQGKGFNPNLELERLEESTKLHGATVGPAYYWFAGGCVYELLSRLYSEPKLYDYCDPTGDIDVRLFPPNLKKKEGQDNKYSNIYYGTPQDELHEYYMHFSTWIFERIVQQLELSESMFHEMFPNSVDFDINEYTEIPIENKRMELGYKDAKIGNLYVVCFLNETNSLLKIQIVLKIQEGEHTIIDHILECMTTLPTIYEYDPTNDKYEPNYQTISFPNHASFNIQRFNTLIAENYDSYGNRKQYYDVLSMRHKLINHVARLLYLFELFYRNRELLSTLTMPINISGAELMKWSRTNSNTFKYYKLVNGEFTRLAVPIEMFYNAYIQLYIEYQMHVIRKKNSYLHSSEEKRLNYALNFATALGNFGGRNIYLIGSNYQENHDNFMRFLFDGEPGPGAELEGGRKKMKRRNTAKTNRNRKQCGTKKHKCYKNRKRY